MPTHLTSSPQWHLAAVKNPGDCAPIAENLKDEAVYEVALCLGFVPNLAQFAQYLDQGTIKIWQCRRAGTDAIAAYAIDVFRFDDHELFVWCEGGWNNAVVAEILPVLSGAVFEGDAKAIRVWMVIPRPVPEGSEECIMGLGFDPWKDDMAKNIKQTYGLERSTWRVYTGQDVP